MKLTPRDIADVFNGASDALAKLEEIRREVRRVEGFYDPDSMGQALDIIRDILERD